MLRISEEVRRAIPQGNVVALESTIITHGMPYPQNLETALLVEQTVRENGSTPATIAILDGVITIGLSRAELERLAKTTSAVKVSRRDIAQTIAKKQTGSTTVAATMIFAHMAGIRIFATGGIGGVHRGAESTWDISADLAELARTPVLVVCAGAKSILDLPRTLELLETGGVSVIGFKTEEFPAFFTPKSGLKTSAVCQTELDVAKTLKTHIDLGLESGLLLTCPVPTDQAGNADAIERATEEALNAAVKMKISGKEITPFMLKYINEKTGGDSLKANIALIRNNAGIAGRVAHQFSRTQNKFSNEINDFGTASKSIRVVGGICLDTIARTEDPEIIGETNTSSPGTIVSGIGGVGRNIAKVIHQLSPSSVSFESCVGSDVSAASISVLKEAMRNPWISLTTINGQRTAHYSAVMNGDGSLCAGIADMGIFDSFQPSTNSPDSQLTLLDTNLSEKAIRTLAVNAKKNSVWIDCVSVAKTERLIFSLPHFALVKANLDELATIAAVPPVDNPDNSEELVNWVASTVRVCIDQYTGNAFLVTCGKFGVFYCKNAASGYHDNNTNKSAVLLPDGAELKIDNLAVNEIKVVRYTCEPIEKVVDSTGAGDCLLGATAWAHIVQGLSVENAVVVGIAAARMTLMSSSAVAQEITNERLKPLIAQLTIVKAKL
jgi:pseudouridine-5'-phosphate glycosidase/pseudouridine kinase